MIFLLFTSPLPPPPAQGVLLLGLLLDHRRAVAVRHEGDSQGHARELHATGGQVRAMIEFFSCMKNFMVIKVKTLENYEQK